MKSWVQSPASPLLLRRFCFPQKPRLGEFLLNYITLCAFMNVTVVSLLPKSSAVLQNTHPHIVFFFSLLCNIATLQLNSNFTDAFKAAANPNQDKSTIWNSHNQISSLAWRTRRPRFPKTNWNVSLSGYSFSMVCQSISDESESREVSSVSEWCWWLSPPLIYPYR